VAQPATVGGLMPAQISICGEICPAAADLGQRAGLAPWRGQPQQGVPGSRFAGTHILQESSRGRRGAGVPWPGGW
jgi:hypothetical protein